MATSQPAGQQRAAFGRDFGNFATVAAMPNGSGNVLPSATVPFNLEAGDRCYLSASGSECEYLCVSAGTAAGGNAVWVPSSGQGPWSNVLYVDQVRGSDTTGQRGNANRPFATPQAAVNAAQTGDAVWLAPQQFTITATITIPATVARIAFYGWKPPFSGSVAASPIGTQLLSTTVDIFSLGANLGLAKCEFSDIDFRASLAGKFAIIADGSLYTVNTFLSAGLFINNCVLGSQGTLSAKYVVTGAVSGGRWTGTFSYVNSGPFTFVGVDAGAVTPTATFTTTDPLAVGLQPTLTLQQATIFGGTPSGTFLTMGGQQRVFVDQTSMIGGLKGSATVPLAVATFSPAVVCIGSIATGNSGIVDFASAGSELPDTATVLSWRFDGARLTALVNGGVGGPITCKFKVGGAGANAQTIVMDSTTWRTNAAIIADVNCNVTLRRAQLPTPTAFPDTTLSTPAGTGTILPPSPLFIQPVAVAGPPTPITLPCRIPAGSTAFAVSYTSDNAASIPTGVITARTQTGFSAGTVAAGGGNLTATVCFPG